MTNDSLRVYADYVCPFCYLGRRVLDRALEEHSDPPAVEWHPFDLRANRRNSAGELVVEEQQDEAYFEQAWQNVERLAAEYGLAVPDQADREVDSLGAQQVSLFVQDEYPDRWRDFDDAVYRAHWQEHRDISDPDVLGELAEEVGLPDETHRSALADQEVQSRLEAAFTEARRDGVTGVPTFVFGDDALRGAVPPQQLRELLDTTASAQTLGTGEE